MVTSGAIALGMRLMELPARPRSIDELQAASAVGQGTLFRAYESRLAARDVHAAQVLLTSFDLSVRMHYLNARRTLRRLLAWRAVPVVNENDTTATDEITFGDNDFLSAQLALLLERAAAGAAHRHRRAAHRRPAPRSGGEADRGGRRLRRARGAARSATGRRAFGSGGMRSKVAAAEMASAAGIPAVICDGTAPGTLLRAPRPARRSARASRRIPSARRRSSSGCATRSRPRPDGGRRRGGAGAARAGLEPAAGRGHRGRGRVRRRRRGRCRSATASWSARGSSTTRRPSWRGSRG